MEHYFVRVGGKIPGKGGQNLGFCSVEGRGLTEQREGDSEIEAGTAQMTNLTCFMVMQRVGPWKHRTVR